MFKECATAIDYSVELLQPSSASERVRCGHPVRGSECAKASTL